MRWTDVDLVNGVVHLHESIAQRGGRRWTKDIKTHQDRRIALSPETVDVLAEHFERWLDRAAALEIKLPSTAYVFSLAPDASTPLVPDSVSQRFSKMADRLGIDTHIHALRHYSATEFITSDIDVSTVGGRLGHGGGGTTTPRVYTAWLADADQRAAGAFGPRMPARPRTSQTATARSGDQQRRTRRAGTGSPRRQGLVAERRHAFVDESAVTG